MRLPMEHALAFVGFVWAFVQAANAQSVGSTSIRDGRVTVTPPEFHGAINNPLKGFRDYKQDAREAAGGEGPAGSAGESGGTVDG